MSNLRAVLAVPIASDIDPRYALEAYGDDSWAEAGVSEADVFRLAERPEAPPAGVVAIVVDVLRATSSLTTAFAARAARVIAAGTVAEARAIAARHAGALLCGERGGRIVPGFDLGNSPYEYTPERVAGKTLVFASTNGSQALAFTAAARARVLAAFLNASAVIEHVAREPEVWLVASGKLGVPAIEDTACVGWIARGLIERGFRAGDPAVEVARRVAPRDAAGVRALVSGCAHARALVACGESFARDVVRCGEVDALAVAPEV